MIEFLITAVVFLFQAGGILLAVRALFIARTSQAAIGWVLGLVVFPYVAIPLFLIFGESKFSGYALAGSGKVPALDDLRANLGRLLEPFAAGDGKFSTLGNMLKREWGFPVLSGNRLRVLVDGDETFPAIYRAIDEARDYLCVQFFIIRHDATGQEFKARLLAAAARGVRVWLLFDFIGSKSLSAEYVEELRRGGVQVRSFSTLREVGIRFQINFRNHRKLVLADGRRALIGGLNVGDEYRGLSPKFGPWRDTHVEIAGPAVLPIQLAFIEDWHYITREILELPEIRPEAAGEQEVLPFAPSPVHPISLASAVYQEAIRKAQNRVWLASPYFVPDFALKTELQLASLRGVDVRILLPGEADHLLPWLSSFNYYTAMRQARVKIFRHQRGFMHQKVLLADDDIAIVGSINLDYRSFMLNFEEAVLVPDEKFAREIEAMLARDFANAREEDLLAYEKGTLWFRLKVRLASLMSPEQ